MVGLTSRAGLTLENTVQKSHTDFGEIPPKHDITQIASPIVGRS